MKLPIKSILAAVIAVVGLATMSAPSSALPVVPSSHITLGNAQSTQPSHVQQIYYRYYRRHYYHGYYRHRYYYRPYYHRHYYYHPYYRPYYRHYYYRPYYRHYYY
jgi:hypothetical protein